jgi:hypothetical protein
MFHKFGGISYPQKIYLTNNSDMVEYSVMEETTTVDDVEISTHYIHWAMCELSWNSDVLKSLTIPISLDRMSAGLDKLKIKFVKFDEDEFGNTIVKLCGRGLPTTYLGTVHQWINQGTIDDNFSWQQQDGFDFTPLLEQHIKQMLEPSSSENFSE